MKLDKFKDMASAMNSKEENEATSALFTLALYTLPIWLPIYFWNQYQDHRADKLQMPIAAMIKTDLKYPEEFNKIKAEDPEYYKMKMDAHLKDPERQPHPSQFGIMETGLKEGGYYEKGFMDLNLSGQISRQEEKDWKKDSQYADKHHAMMQDNYERYAHIDGYKKLVEGMAAETAKSVGWYATEYSENFKFLQNYYKDDLYNFRKTLTHGLMAYNHPKRDNKDVFWRGHLDLTIPVNQKQAEMIKNKEKRKAEFEALLKDIERR